MTTYWEGHDRQGRPFIIREAEPLDARAWLQHTQRLLAETPFMLQSQEDPLPSLGEQERSLARFSRIPGSVALLAEEPGGDRRAPLLGSITLAGSQVSRLAHVAELSIGVARHAWGRGVGDALLRAAIAHARADATLMRLSLNVFARNAPARALYLKHGFREEGRLRAYVRHGDDCEDLIPMGLWLADTRATG